MSGISFHLTNECRSCGHALLKLIMELGKIPIADALLKADQLLLPETLIPLSLAFCEACSLVQIREEVDPKVLFGRDYPYFSSVSPALLKHFKDSAHAIIKNHALKKEQFVLEIASNDGILLQHFVNQKIPCLGVEPATNQAKQANEQGIPTLNAFFSHDLALEIVKSHGHADILLANNVLAHVPDLRGFVKGIHTLLSEDGTAIIEVPYLPKTIDNLEFDQVFHQHFSYFSLNALTHLFASEYLFINDAVNIPIHGGSIRFYVQKQKSPQPGYLSLLKAELTKGIDKKEYYLGFAESVNNLKTRLMDQLNALKTDKKTIVGYGAAGKANTLMSYFGINAHHLDYICDLSPHKQGLYFTGNHLPIVSPQKILDDQPDYVLILAWNFVTEIMEQLKEYHKRGGKFIIPIPSVTIC